MSVSIGRYLNIKFRMDYYKKRSIKFENKYYDLIMAVERKFTEESRHETAKRYIREREQSEGCLSSSIMYAKKGRTNHVRL